MRHVKVNPHTGGSNNFRSVSEKSIPRSERPLTRALSEIGLAIIMTAAASANFFRPEFGDFLYAPLAASEHESHLTVLSALSRLGLDPWKEAADLSALSKNMAAARLASLITVMDEYGREWNRSSLDR